ncbi:hypothetical protein SAMN04487926_12147 [Paraburkholderia steynii]|uniref:Uncharacterized protein n=1 Tax=Paraburkholderia steynii TaxID=1245441 RepID=A0A7Z7FJT5_9BURK|nr:hypothetical protein [Paraburkholderia steynii]SDI65138.1 hypothetical protein SAMN04487926_12147 [Paraburkholderia steynii]
MAGARQYKTQTPGAPVNSELSDGPVIAGTGSDGVIEIAGREVALDDVVQGAFETSGMSLDEWNAADGEKRDELIAAQRRDMESMFRSSQDLPGQDAAREAAVAAVNARKAARAQAQASSDSAVPAAPALPHSSEIDPASLAAPKLCRDGWLVPTTQRQLPRNFQ